MRLSHRRPATGFLGTTDESLDLFYRDVGQILGDFGRQDGTQIVAISGAQGTKGARIRNNHKAAEPALRRPLHEERGEVLGKALFGKTMPVGWLKRTLCPAPVFHPARPVAREFAHGRVLDLFLRNHAQIGVLGTAFIAEQEVLLAIRNDDPSVMCQPHTALRAWGQ